MKWLRCFKDIMRFSNMNPSWKRLVFYSEGAAYWAHLGGLVKAALDLGMHVSFVSSDEHDPVFQYQNKYLQTFLIDEGYLRNWWFKTLQADILVMTMPDLDQYQIKRSRHPVHYVYVHHALVSHHMVYRKGAFDAFDTILCAGPHHKKEIRAIEKHYGLKKKNLLEHGYGRLDDLLNRSVKTNDSDLIKHVLVAPTWGASGMIHHGCYEVISVLLEEGYHVTLRPHPQTLKHNRNIITRIQDAFGARGLFSVDIDGSGMQALLDADVLITDWSGVAIDFGLGLKRPVIFIDVPRKVNNPEYELFDLEPFEVMIREHIGCVISPKDIYAHLIQSIQDLVLRKNIDHDCLLDQHTYNVGSVHLQGANILHALQDTVRSSNVIEKQSSQ